MVALTSFLVSTAGKDDSKSSNSFMWFPWCCVGAEKSPPSRSSSPSSIVACFVSLPDEKNSASSPSAAFSRSRKFPEPAVEVLLTSV